MKKKLFVLAAFTVCMGLMLSGCKKEQEAEGPKEAILSAVSLNDLEPGHFYVKSGDSFYLLSVEDCNFDPARPAQSADSKDRGMTSQAENRLLGFVRRDMAVPTLYKNDQLIYVSDGSISAFTWERFRDCGYSIGFSGLVLSESGKIKSAPQTVCCEGSTLKTTLETLGLGRDTDVTVDSINGTTLSPQYLNSAGIITGMSKDAAAKVDLYLGTQHTPVSVAADTRYYQSFELYQTAKYTLSTDGYAIVEVPAYFRSGYYLINNLGFVKFLNVDRGVDESGIDLNSAYYYEGKEGKTLTFYEWQEENGIQTSGGQSPAQTQAILDAEDYEERYLISVDSTQESMAVTVAYRYMDEESRISAGQNGTFPKVYLVSPTGESVTLTEDESRTYSAGNPESDTYLEATVNGVAAGEWQLLYSNFDKIHKRVEVSLNSGNATSYVHNGSSGSIRIYYGPSGQAHDFTITWEHADRALADLKLTAPDGTVYSKSTTPGNVMADEYGKYVIKVPNLVKGDYRFDMKGESLGRVWVACDESVFFHREETDHAEEPAETQEESSESAGTEE